MRAVDRLVRRLGRAARGLTRVGLTRRGAVALAAGIVLVVVGATLGLPDVVGLGTAPILAVGLVSVWMGARRLERGRGALHVTRRIQPNPAVRGQVTTARLSVGTVHPSPTASGRLTRLRISEQAAHELCDQDSLRAEVATGADRIAVRYRLTPLNRGRWTLGPLLTSRVDVFGLVRARQTLGDATLVAVWPRTVELPVRATGALGDLERSTAGARLSSTDDSILRDYVAGDDPRRVHWASAARHGQLMVRSDESAGLPAVSVVLDRGLLPHPDLGVSSRRADGEWAVECAASIAVSLLRAGHPVRLVPTTPVPVVDGIGFSASRGNEGAAHLLNTTLDLRGHRTAGEADQAVTATAEALRTDHRTGDITVAVLGPLGAVARQTVAAMAGDGLHWALIVDSRPASAAHDDAVDTASALRSTGWHVALVDPSLSIEQAWARLVDGAR